MPTTLKRIEPVPVTQGETRRKLLLMLYLTGTINPDDKSSDVVDIGQVDYMVLKT